MTQQDRQQPQQDERVLDYIYGELPPDERAAFEAQLDGDAELRRELESMQKVHGAFQSLPKVQQSPESAQRMTALLMQAAAEHAAKPADKAPPQPDADASGGGKLLEMRPRGFRRFFQSPATGIFAAAAAALFWVVFKTQAPMPRQSANPALEPAVTVAAAPTEALHAQPVEGAMPKPVADNFGGGLGRGESAKPAEPAEPAGSAKMETPPATIATVTGSGDAANVGNRAGKSGQTGSLKEAFSTALSKSAPAKPTATTPTPEPIYASRDGSSKKVAGKPMAPFAANDKPKYEKAEEKKPVLLAQTELENRKEAKADSLAGQRMAEAPMAKAADEAKGAGRGSDSVRAQMEQTQARRKDRIVEQLADQELGTMPTPVGGSAHPTTPASPPEEPESGRYAMNQAPASPPPPPAAAPPAMDDAPLASNRDYRAQNAAPGAAPPSNYANQAGPRRAVSNNNSDSDSAGSGLLATVQEQLRQGHCADANSTLLRIEQSFPATRGLAETRAQWQRSCQPQGQQAPNLMNLERQQMMAQPESPIQMNRSAAPSPSYKMAAPPRAAKRAAPAKSRASDAKAADAY